jgi:hypothetical protein
MSTTSQDLEGTTEAQDAGGASTYGNGGPAQAARTVAGNVATAASEAVSRLPEATQTTRAAVEEANRAIQAGSDEMLVAGTTLSVGLALGLLLGGANRLLVIVALIPAAAMGFTLLDRSQSGRAAVKRA